MTLPVPAETVPDYQSLMLPVLRAAAAGEQRIGAVMQSLGEELALSEAARAALLASGRQTIFANRVHWAKTYLAKAGLVEATRRGHFRLTQRGADVLAASPDRIDNRFLSRFEEFRQFSDRSASQPTRRSCPNLPTPPSRRRMRSCAPRIGGSRLRWPRTFWTACAPRRRISSSA
jgi:restriction system protein